MGKGRVACIYDTIWFLGDEMGGAISVYLMRNGIKNESGLVWAPEALTHSSWEVLGDLTVSPTVYSQGLCRTGSHTKVVSHSQREG